MGNATLALRSAPDKLHLPLGPPQRARSDLDPLLVLVAAGAPRQPGNRSPGLRLAVDDLSYYQSLVH